MIQLLQIQNDSKYYFKTQAQILNITMDWSKVVESKL